MAIAGAGGGAPAIINNQAGTPISFRLTENRTQSVKVSLFIKEAPAKKIVTDGATLTLDSFRSVSGLSESNSVPGPITWGDAPISLFGTKSDIAFLPFESRFELNWKGVVAGGDGAPLADGNYTLCLNVKDGDDNNSSDAADLCDTSVRVAAVLIPSVVENAVRAIFQTRVVGRANIGRRELTFRFRAGAHSSARARAQLSGEVLDLAVLARDPDAGQRPSTAAENGPRHGLMLSSPRARTGGLTLATLPPGFARSADETGNNALGRGLRSSLPRALARPRLDRAHELGRLRTLGRQASLDPAPVARAQLSREQLTVARLRTLGRRASSVAFAAAGGAAAAPGVSTLFRWRGRPARAERSTQALHFRAFRAAQFRARAGTGGAPPAQLLVRARPLELFARARLWERYSDVPLEI